MKEKTSSKVPTGVKGFDKLIGGGIPEADLVLLSGPCGAGKTIFGINVVRDIADEDHDNSSPAGGGKPLIDIIINSITIENY